MIYTCELNDDDIKRRFNQELNVEHDNEANNVWDWLWDWSKLLNQTSSQAHEILKLLESPAAGPELSVLIRRRLPITQENALTIRNAVEGPRQMLERLAERELTGSSVVSILNENICECLTLCAVTKAMCDYYAFYGLQDVHVFYNEIFELSLAQMKKLLIHIERMDATPGLRLVQLPLTALNNECLLGAIIQLGLSEALVIGPIQDAMLMAMDEPFSRIQMRPTSKRFLFNVFTLGIFTKWAIPGASDILLRRTDKSIPNRLFFVDIMNLEIGNNKPSHDEQLTLIPDNETKKHIGNGQNAGKIRPKKTRTVTNGIIEWFYLWQWFISTRRVKLIEKAIFDLILIVVLAWYSILGQTYKPKKMDHAVLLITLMMFYRTFRFMFCSIFRVDAHRKHPFRIPRLTVSQYGYVLQFVLLILRK